MSERRGSPVFDSVRRQAVCWPVSGSCRQVTVALLTVLVAEVTLTANGHSFIFPVAL